MTPDSIEEDKFKKLLSLDNSKNTPAQRASMIIQGVNWLTLVQEVFILFLYKLPLALFSMAKTLSHQKENS
ncbi:hypothetical protein [Thiomicrorhabdus sp.]|uniref:hypothetical protein n=1 Tax=Thiomicrorhabdus sp. TaxID=2039724 RepID=UPI002AA6C856|nr:hypothetical protein [Thiomicrorhabdus sp.]